MKRTQVDRLMALECPRDDLIRSGYSGPLPDKSKHHLIKVYTRRLRDRFRRRNWWRCHDCDLREEVEGGLYGPTTR